MVSLYFPVLFSRTFNMCAGKLETLQHLYLMVVYAFIALPLFSFTVQRGETQRRMGNVAPDIGCRGIVCHRQHLQLLAPHLPFHCQLPSGPLTDLTGPHAPGHPQVPLHLLSSSVSLCQWPQPALLLL